jgi:glucuronate isomerase
VVVVPTFRPDAALKIDQPEVFLPWLEALGSAAGTDVSSYADLVDALRLRHAAFHEAGCRASDHGIEEPYAVEWNDAEAARVFAEALSGREIPEGDLRLYRSALMYELGCMNAERGWAQQFHLGALRNTNTSAFDRLGPDTGFDSIAERPLADGLARFFDRLERSGSLARTIVYTLNPSQNEAIATAVGNFQGDGIAGKMQFGSAWWYNDQKDGMTRQLDALSAMGILSVFVGMLTDSRSFLSYPRHDYFRRILCDLIGDEAERGELPSDLPLLGSMIQDICYHNAHRYFRIPRVAAAEGGES